MHSFKKYLPWIIRAVVAALFVLSAIAKLYPGPTTALATFEAKQLIPMGFSELLAPYVSRFLIIAEFSIGVALLQSHFLKRFVLPAATLLLAVFSAHLAYDVLANGASGGNCGCFGQLIPMTPLQALLKNIIAMGMLGGLFKLLKKDPPGQQFLFNALIFTTIGMVVFAAAPVQFTSRAASVHNAGAIHSDFSSPQKFNPPEHSTPTTAGPTAETKSPEAKTKTPRGPEAVVSTFSAFPQYVPEEVQIDKGKKILCLFAPGCDHCSEALKKLTAMRNEIDGFPPVHIVFMDEEPEKIPGVFEFAGRTYSYRVAPVAEFWKIIDFSRDTPGVVYLWNGNIRYFADGIDDNAFDEKSLKAALIEK